MTRTLFLASGTRRLTASNTSRRGLLGAAAFGLLAARQLADGGSDIEAKNRKKKRRRKQKRKKNRDSPDTPSAPDTPNAPDTPDPTTIRVDATCPGPTDNAGISLDAGAKAAQTFTALTTGQLVGAELLIFASATGSADLTLQLRDIDASGVPTNEVLGEATVLSPVVPAGENTVAFSFPTAPPVAASREYALVLAKRGARTISWKGHRTSACDGRAFESEATNEPFEPQVADLDLIFSTLVRA